MYRAFSHNEVPLPVYCWDYATNSSCWNETKSIVANRVYSMQLDVINPNGCILYASDGGQIGFLDAISGERKCASDPEIYIEGKAFEPVTTCSTTSSVSSFGSFLLSNLNTTTANTTIDKITITVEDTWGEDVVGWIELNITADVPLNLAKLSPDVTGPSPTFKLKFWNVRNGYVVGAEVDFLYDGRGPELCATVEVRPLDLPAAQLPCPVISITGSLYEDMVLPIKDVVVYTDMPPRTFVGSANETVCPTNISFASEPGPVANLTATILDAGTGDVTIKWNAPVDDGGFPVLFYEVSADSGLSWVAINNPTEDPLGSGNFNNVQPGPLANITLRAVSIVGRGNGTLVNVGP